MADRGPIVSGPALPLNIKGSQNPFREELSLRRSAAGLEVGMRRGSARQRSAPGLDLFRHRSATENSGGPRSGGPPNGLQPALRAGLRRCSKSTLQPYVTRVE